MLSLGYRYVYAIVMSIAGLALCLRVSENPALATTTAATTKAKGVKDSNGGRS